MIECNCFRPNVQKPPKSMLFGEYHANYQQMIIPYIKGFIGLDPTLCCLDLLFTPSDYKCMPFYID